MAETSFRGYRVIEAVTIEWLERDVNELVRKGWEPCGSLLFHAQPFENGEDAGTEYLYMHALVLRGAATGPNDG